MGIEEDVPMEDEATEVETSVLDIEDDDAILVDEEDMTPEDALAVIMSARPVHQTKKVSIKGREGMGRIVLTLRSLTDREFKAVRKQSEIPSGNRKDQRAGKKETDDSLFLRLVVAAGIESPKIFAADVLKAHRVTTPDQLVDKLILPGVIAQLAENIMELSGWDEESVTDLSLD